MHCYIALLYTFSYITCCITCYLALNLITCGAPWTTAGLIWFACLQCSVSQCDGSYCCDICSQWSMDLHFWFADKDHHKVVLRGCGFFHLLSWMELRLLQQQHAELTTASHPNAPRTGWRIQTKLVNSGQWVNWRRHCTHKAVDNARAALLNVDGSAKAC